MLNCLSANALLKSVVATMATIVVILLGLSSWDARQRLAVAGRATVVADASAYAFKAMHIMRTDRSTTVRKTFGMPPGDTAEGVEAAAKALGEQSERLRGQVFLAKIRGA